MIASKCKMPIKNPAFPFFRYWGICFFHYLHTAARSVSVVYGQAEVAPWGNITGIRIGGQLIGFESSLRVVEKDWSKIKATGKERQRPKYIRDGNKQVVTTKIDSLSFTEIVEDTKTGMANVNVQLSSNSEMKMEGVFFSVALPLGKLLYGCGATG